MRSSEFHVSLSGIKYRLAEDAEGEHYVRARESLRPPNSQIVQGEAGNVFNSRPDMLLWSWTDWSDGEGQIKFDPAQPGRSLILENVNPFDRPGTIQPGYFGYEVRDGSGSGAAFNVQTGLVVSANSLYAVGVGTGHDDYYLWDSLDDVSWELGVSMGITDGARREEAICGDPTYIYFVQASTDNIYRVTPGGAVTLLNNQTASYDTQLTELGDYLYKYDINGKIWEVSKTTVNTTTAETPIYDFSASGGSDNHEGQRLIAGDNRIYAGAVQGQTTLIFEIVPSSAAGTGFGREIARIPGMILESMWWHGGFLWWTARDGEGAVIGTDRGVFYYQPGAAWGTVGLVRSSEVGVAISGNTSAAGANRLHTSGFSAAGTWSGRTFAQADLSLFEVDAVSGGFAQTGRSPDGLDVYSPDAAIFWDGKFVVAGSTIAPRYRQVVWNTTDFSTQTGTAVSPSNDFGLAGDKILHSIEIETESLPAATSVTVSYSLDGAAWVALTAHDTDGSDGTKWSISTGAATKTFRSMSLKIELLGTQYVTPVVKSVDVRASVDEHVNVWQLLLDCSDESSPRGHSGQTLISNLTGLSDNDVITFIDGYPTRTFSDDTTYNVVVDNMAVILTKPGEGYIQITLREVF